MDKVVEILLKDVSKHTEGREVMRDSQHGFTKAEFCQNRLAAFYGGVTVLVDKGRAMDVVCLDFWMVFESPSQHSYL